jgi:P-type E1-E2 ATPase
MKATDPVCKMQVETEKVRWFMEGKARTRVSDATTKLLQLQPKTARRIRDGKTEDASLDDIRVGDILVIRPGENIPADGTIIHGASSACSSGMPWH